MLPALLQDGWKAVGGALRVENLWYTDGSHHDFGNVHQPNTCHGKSSPFNLLASWQETFQIDTRPGNALQFSKTAPRQVTVSMTSVLGADIGELAEAFLENANI